MKVKITKAARKSFWYADRIGDVFTVVCETLSPDVFVVLSKVYDDEDDAEIVNYKTKYFINKDDCVPNKKV